MSPRTIAHHLLIHLTWVSGCHALVIPDYNATRHNRFLSFPANPAHNAQFMHAGYDLSGVGWHTAKTARQLTMVSPVHFVGANHYRPGVNATIRFLSAAPAVLRDFTVASETAVTNDNGDASDLFIGTLATAMTAADGIRFYPYLNLGSEAGYVNLPLIVLGKPGRGAAGTLSVIQDAPSSGLNTTRVARFDYSTATGGADGCYFESGDSGSPLFAVHNNTAAIIGTHSLVGSISVAGTTTYSNYSNFIPHYIDKFNAVMENQGYRMTKAIPGSTQLALTHTPPPVARAARPFTLGLNLENTGATMAENVKLGNLLPQEANVTAAGGSLWFDESTAAATRARRAKIAPGGDTDYALTITIPTPGSYQHTVTYSSDQSPPQTEHFNLTVIESFASWASGLADKTPGGDDDMDGVSNLLEYAFGGDPTSPSLRVAGETTRLLPVFSRSGNSHTISYVRRKDAGQRALSYSLTCSTTLLPGSFTDASSLISQTDSSPVNDGFELITHTLTTSETERFFRIEVTLSE